MALCFTLLLAARSEGVCGARWREVGGNMWKVPAKGMKGAVGRRMPLTDEWWSQHRLA